MKLMELPLWAWIVFYVLVLLMLVADLNKYLKYGLGVILIFVGIKMLLAMNEYINSLGELVGLNLNIPHIEVPTPVSLAVIFGVLALSMLLSYFATTIWTKQTEKLD